MPSENQQSAEDLLQEAKQNRRHTTDAPGQSQDAEPEPEPVDLSAAIADGYAAIDAGEKPSNLTLRDGDLAALFAGLEESGELDQIISAAHDTLDRSGEPDSYTRATALRLLVRVALTEIDPDAIEAAIDGKKQFMASQAAEF